VEQATDREVKDMPETFLDGRVVLHPGDCLDVLARLDECSIDSCVTDPPYHLTSIVNRMSAPNAAPVGYGSDGRYQRMSKGFMGKQWDGGDVAFRPETWREVYRVLKPGGHLLAFGGCRTYHRMAVAIEDAGFEIRQMLSWIFGSGFPKSHSMRHIGRPELGTDLKPAHEPICMARKPLSEGTVAANVLRWGTGAINVDGCRVESCAESFKDTRDAKHNDVYGKFNPSDYDGSKGRWPANVIHDGSEEVTAAFPDAPGQQRATGPEFKSERNVYGIYAETVAHEPRGDTGSAARFFYTAKADADDRLGSKHPTVKPVDLMQYLVRLVTPRGGVCLDPFAGTGTTGEAAWREGMCAVLVEAEAEYQADIRRRMALALAGPDERVRESIKARGTPIDYGPLFAALQEAAE
jgi:site-specific DNA-methyltransferase (adenine-specific)